MNIEVYESIHSDTPLLQASSGQYDENFFYLYPDLYLTLTPGQDYGIQFQSTENSLPEIVSAKFIERIDACYKFELSANCYNWLSWVCCSWLADDDFMWSVECPVGDPEAEDPAPEGLLGLLGNPVGWVNGLNNLIGNTAKGHEMCLMDTFTIQMSTDEHGTVGNNRVQIDGISQTGILRILISKSAVEKLRLYVQGQLPSYPLKGRGEDTAAKTQCCDNLNAYWQGVFDFIQMENQGETPTLIETASSQNGDGRGFSHLKIFNATLGNRLKDWKITREVWIAAYLGARLTDPEGYACFLSHFPTWTVVESLRSNNPDIEIKICVKRASDLKFLYAADLPGGRRGDDENECCDVQYGVTSGSSPKTYTIDNGIVKDYAIEKCV